MKTVLTREGFDIRFEAFSMNEGIEDYLSFEATRVDHSETIARVNSGDLGYFEAKVVACKNGIELAAEYLDGCTYEQEEEFYTEQGGSFDDMVNGVVAEAKLVIEKLSKEETPVYALFQTDIYETKSTRVFFGVFSTESKAVEAAKEKGLYVNTAAVVIVGTTLDELNEG